jgi:hypothetical protein
MQDIQVQWLRLSQAASRPSQSKLSNYSTSVSEYSTTGSECSTCQLAKWVASSSTDYSSVVSDFLATTTDYIKPFKPGTSHLINYHTTDGAAN